MKNIVYDKKEIGKRIDFIRMEKGLNKEEFAKKLGMSGQQLGEIIRGKTGLSVEKLIILSEISGYSTDFILIGKRKEMDENITNSIINIKKNLKQINKDFSNIEMIL